MTTAHKDEWNHFIEQEEGEMMALELIESVILNSQKVIFAKQIDVQILPYTVNYAESLLTDFINFYYYQRDPGNVDATLWIPDEEPESVMIDSWAPAAVPIRKASKKLFLTSRGEAETIKDPTYVPIPTPKEKLKKEEPIKETVKTKPTPLRRKNPVSVPKAPARIPVPLTKKETSMPIDTAPAGLTSIVSEENKKIMAKMAGAAEEWTFDNTGRIVPVTPVGAWNPVQEVKYKVTAHTSLPPPPNPNPKKEKPKVRKEKEKERGFVEDSKLSIPLLADVMKIAPGVTLREGDVVKANALKEDEIPRRLDISSVKDGFGECLVGVLEEVIKGGAPNSIN